jgi:hypothetical protein
MSFKERLEKEQKGFSRWRKAFLFISTFLGKNSSFSGKTLCFQIFVFWGLGFGLVLEGSLGIALRGHESSNPRD